MAVLVVSPTSALSLGLSASLDVIGVHPAGLNEWLATDVAIDGAIVDDAGGPAMAVMAARQVRIASPTAPLVVLVSAGVSPDRVAIQDLEPVRLVRRPFTAAQLADEIRRLGSPAAGRSAPKSSAATMRPGATADEVEPSHTAAHPLSYDRGSLLSAIRTLLEDVEFVSLEDAGDVMFEEAAEAVPSHDGAALLVADGDVWVVAAGRGLRPNERRVLVSSTHWLIRRMASGATAVIVSGTDVARQELHSIPLANLENWMAATLAGANAIVVLARTEQPPFAVRDALRVRNRLEAMAPLLDEALLTRDLAQKLAPYSA